VGGMGQRELVKAAAMKDAQIMFRKEESVSGMRTENWGQL